MHGLMGAAMLALSVGCGSDTTSGGATDTAHGGDTSPSEEDTDSGVEVASDPDGTRYPIAASTGVIDGTFETRPEAAFDGEVEQAADLVAVTDIFENLEEAPLLYKELGCETRLRRVEVHPPTEGHLLYHATNYPNGGTGTVTVVGRRADIDFWYTVASKPFAATGPVVFGPEELGDVSDYVAYGVQFGKDDPLAGELRVAEVALFGYCASPEHTIAWQMSDWICSDVECVAVPNPGGLERRTVTCARDSGGFAHPDLCEGDEPAREGESCTLECPHTLRYIGPRGFTYDNGSGWLHEGRPGFRAGPLPNEVDFAISVDAIEGKPCSVLTADERTFFLAISCVEAQPEGEEVQYCAFRCE